MAISPQQNTHTPLQSSWIVDAGHNGLGDLAQVLVMREIDHLARPRHFSKQPEHLLRPDMVEGFHDVVGDEGNRGPKLGEFVVSGKPQGQIELKARAL